MSQKPINKKPDHQTADKPPQAVFDLYDAYAHGALSRRAFFDRLKIYAVGGTSVAALAGAVMPDYANAKQTEEDDNRLVTERLLYNSPKGAGEMQGYLAKPADMTAPAGGVIVIHENRGLNPHIADVARRAALAGYVAFAPDALYPLGGYPGNDDDGRTLQRQRDGKEMLEDFIAAADFLKAHPDCTGKVACVGFCFGGAIANLMAVRMDDLAGAVPFYGGWPNDADAARVSAPLQIHLAGLDRRINAGWPDYKAALTASDVAFDAYTYPDVNHGFHNDTTGRFNEDAAKLAWSRTLDFFARTIG